MSNLFKIGDKNRCQFMVCDAMYLILWASFVNLIRKPLNQNLIIYNMIRQDEIILIDEQLLFAYTRKMSMTILFLNDTSHQSFQNLYDCEVVKGTIKSFIASNGK